jgi:CheY-like chemotaxis protein
VSIPTKRPLTILVVEDHDDSRMMMKVLLELDGFSVITASTAGRGVLLAAQTHPDLIMMDIGLPDFDGLTAVRRVRRELATRSTPIIALTAYNANETRRQAFAAGCNEFILKPVDPDQLEATIERLLPHASGGPSGESTPAQTRADYRRGAKELATRVERNSRGYSPTVPVSRASGESWRNRT